MNIVQQIRAAADGPSLCPQLLGESILVSREFLREVANRLENAEGVRSAMAAGAEQQAA